MNECVYTTRTVAATPESVKEAAVSIRGGGIVAFPTETVYGLGADATNARAVASIFAAKNRPSFNPLIVHVHSPEAAESYVRVSDSARVVMKAFWPGPLTLILPKCEECSVSDLVSAGLSTLAVRMPSHPKALAFLEQAGVPVAAPSANASGEPSATTPRHVYESLQGRIPLILADGACTVGLESTVLDLSGERPVIVRPGAVTAEMLSPFLGEVTYDFGSHEKPTSPGQLAKHYAPSIPVRLNAVDVEEGEVLLAFGPTRFMGMKNGGFAKEKLSPLSFRNLSEIGDLYEAASNFFTMLRDLDRPQHRGIAVMPIPEIGLGLAINDRLRRAAAGR